MKTKYLLITLLALFASISASAETWTDENGTVWNFTVSSGKASLYKGYNTPCISGAIPTSLTIPATVYNGTTAYPVTSIGNYAFYNCSSLTAITIPEGVTSIGDYAFYNCSSLSAINIPEGVTSIGGYAFQNCYSLTAINIPEGVTSIAKNAFYNCSSLTAITIPEGVTSIGSSAFYNCSSLTAITIPEGVTWIGSSAFYNCSSFTAINIPESVTSIGESAFYKCSSLTAINIPEGVTSIAKNAFYNCSNLTAVTIPESVTWIGNDVFHGCSSLTAVTIPEGVTWIGNSAFSGCSSLTAVTIPESVTSIEAFTFSGCSSLTAITIPESVTSIGSYAFQLCSSLTAITIPEGVTSIGDDAFFFCTSLTDINIPSRVRSIGDCAFPTSLSSIVVDESNEIYDSRDDCNAIIETATNTLKIGCKNTIIPNSVTSIGYAAFDNCSSLTTITIPEGVTWIGSSAFAGTSADIHFIVTTPPTVQSNTFNSANTVIVPASAFEAYCSAEGWSDMKSYVFPDDVVDTEVTIEAKSDRPALLVAIGEENLANVLNLKVHGTLNGYDVMVLRNKMVRLRNLDLGDATLLANDNGYQYYTGYSVQEGVFGAYFFYNCANLQSIIFPKEITSIGSYALMGTNLRSVIIPEGVKWIGQCAFKGMRTLKTITFPSTLNSIGSSAFYNCGFTELDLPSVTTIGSNAFTGCYSLKTITFPSTLNSIGSEAFYSCSGLTELRLPPSVKTIGERAFRNCSALTEVRIPSSITSIGDYAFNGCDNVKKVYTYTLEPTSIDQNTFSTFTTATLYVPHQSYWTYWMNTQWSQFLTINEFNEPYEYFYLNGDYTLDDDTGTLDGNPDADLNDGSGLIVDGSDTQGLDDVNQNQNGDGTGSSIIGNDDGENTGNLDVNYLHIKITVSANKWYFFCFPFNVNVADCTYPGDYVWKEYKGLLRATTGKGWKTFDGNLLEAFHGYGFRTNKAGTLVITVQKPKFGGDRPATLLEYIAESIQDASWNLIGNAYSSYYNFTEQDFDAPFTVWNGSSYVAYRPGDDDYHLRPYEAFFTQKPSHADKVQFKAERRETHKQSQATAAKQAQRRRERGINPDRLLTNLFITDNDTAYVDRTRVVLNERASHDYEIECDAAKFLSTDAPAQLYTTGDNVQYAINERPAAGDIHLAYVAMKAGQLSIGAERMDQPMVLVDTEMGTTFDLSLGTYDFTTEAGTFEHRFLLRPASGVVTALADLRQQTGVLIGQQTGGIAIGGAEGKNVNVYTTDGALVASHNGNGFVALKRGIYVINVDGKTAKVPVR